MSVEPGLLHGWRTTLCTQRLEDNLNSPNEFVTAEHMRRNVHVKTIGKRHKNPQTLEEFQTVT